MTFEPDLIRVIRENALTLDENATGLFNMNEFIKSDFIYKDNVVKGNSITLYSDNLTHTMRLYSPIGLNEERR